MRRGLLDLIVRLFAATICEEAEQMKLNLRADEINNLRSSRVDLAEYGYSDAAKAKEPVSGKDIRKAFPARSDASFLRRDRQH